MGYVGKDHDFKPLKEKILAWLAGGPLKVPEKDSLKPEGDKIYHYGHHFLAAARLRDADGQLTGQLAVSQCPSTRQTNRLLSQLERCVDWKHVGFFGDPYDKNEVAAYEAFSNLDLNTVEGFEAMRPYANLLDKLITSQDDIRHVLIPYFRGLNFGSHLEALIIKMVRGEPVDLDLHKWKGRWPREWYRLLRYAIPLMAPQELPILLTREDIPEDCAELITRRLS